MMAVGIPIAASGVASAEQDCGRTTAAPVRAFARWWRPSHPSSVLAPGGSGPGRLRILSAWWSMKML